MDRNSVLGLVAIAIILVVWSVMMRPNEEEQKRLLEAQAKQDSIELLAIQKKTEQEALPVTTEKGASVNDSLRKEENKKQLGSFAAAANGEQKFFILQNEKLMLKVSSKGGRIYSATVKEFHRYDSTDVVLFNGDSTIFGFSFFSETRNRIQTNDLFFSAINSTDSSLTMRLNITDSNYIDYVYKLSGNSYVLDYKVLLVGMNGIIASNIDALDLKWEIYTPRIEKDGKNESIYATLSYKYFQDDVEELKPRSDKEQIETLSTKIEWIAFKNQFFSSVILADETFRGGSVKSIKFEDNSKYIKKYSSDLVVNYNQKMLDTIPFKMYFGPNHVSTVKKTGLPLDGLVTLGGSFIRVINKYAVVPIFFFLEKFFSNYGIIILLLTLIIKIGLLPLTFTSYMSTAKMKVLKPQVDEINERIPKDKAMERQQAMMAMYKKAGVNPLGGCIPLLLQMPILIALYQFFPASFELRQEAFLWAKDLSTYDSILTLPFAIPMYGSHVSLFTLLMTITTIMSMKMNDQTANSATMPGMKTMMYIMPVMLMLVLNSFSAGLTYYLFVANVITIGQNELFKLFIDEKKLLKKLNEAKKKPSKKSKFQQRLEDVAKQRGYKLPK